MSFLYVGLLQKFFSVGLMIKPCVETQVNRYARLFFEVLLYLLYNSVWIPLKISVVQRREMNSLFHGFLLDAHHFMASIEFYHS